MSGIGHNNGPAMDRGVSYRRHIWSRARASLIGARMPIEVLRLRVARAKALGLPYKTYASIRAASGHDVVAFLFSGNALGLTPSRAVMPNPEAARLRALAGTAARVAAVYAPAHPQAVAAAHTDVLEAATPAPAFTAGWAETRARIGAAVRAAGVCADGVVLVPATAVERDWALAGKLGGIVPASVFFAAE